MSENGEIALGERDKNKGMPLDHASCYRALLARDSRFDGVFYVGVKSTGIYCRPVCTARTPLSKNCRFFASAAAAEGSRFRPCLRCRPELAPGQAPMDSPQRLALQAAARIQAGALTGGSLETLAAELGIGSRQLRRVTKEYLGATPVELAQTQRLLLAKQLLAETRLPVIDVAMASGFSSLRRFNALVRSSYGMTPRMMRRKAGRDTTDAPLELMLAYRPPLAWQELLAFLRPRAIPGVELVAGDCYARTVRIGKHTGWVAVRPRADRAALTVEVASSLLRCLPEVMSRLRGLFDLNARPDVIAQSLANDPRLRGAVRRRPGLRVPGAFDGFEIAVRALVGQQTSVAAATTIAGRLAERYGESIDTPFPGLSRTTLQAAALRSVPPARLAQLGLTSRRAAALVELARAADSGAIALNADTAPERTIGALCEIDGIGDWTAQYIAMRALRWPDAFPAGDLLLKRLLGGSERAARSAAERWRPWRAYGALHTWTMHT